jgi:hypothetical protein
MGERHFAKDVTLGEDSRHPVFGIDHRDGPDVVVKHFVDGVGYAGIQRNRRDFPVTKFQYAHKDSLWPHSAEPVWHRKSD